MLHRDDRYDLIKPMIEKGNVQSFSDIFKYIPKTIVATDMGKKVDRFTQLMSQIDAFTLKDLFLIGKFFELEESEILRLALAEYLIQKKNRQVKL